MNGWIKLHRSLVKWEWYDDINVKVTFLHLLLSANHAPKKWRGIDIGRGQLWTSIGNLAKEIGLSEKQIRNSLKKLERTNEISIKGASKGTMITVCKYDSYQDTKEDKGEQTGKPKANEGQAKGKQGATNNNDNNTNNDNNGNKQVNKEQHFEDSSLNDAFEDFKLHRKQLKKPMTEKVIELAVKKLQKVNEKVAIEMIQQSIENGWSGLFEVKEQAKKKTTSDHYYINENGSKILKGVL